MSAGDSNPAFAAALAHHEAGRLAEAERLYREVLAVDPQHGPALHYLGVVAGQTNRADIALELLERAQALLPDDAELHANLGLLYARQRRIEPALAALRRVLTLRPDQAAPHLRIGLVLAAVGRHEEAIPHFERAVRLEPETPQPYLSLGHACFALRRFPEAAAAFARASVLQPSDAATLASLGDALFSCGRLDEAEAAARAALQRDPNLGAAHRSLGRIYSAQGQVEAAVAHLRNAVRLAPADAAAHSELVFLLGYLPGCGAAEIAAELACWQERHAANITPEAGHVRDRDPQRRLRVGYVSPDLHQHALGLNLLPLFFHHDRHQVEIYCYADVFRRDHLTAHFQAQAQNWRETQNRSDAEVADLVRADQIDILVDLALHSPRNRLLVFARQSAPVQVTFGGYPGSTGLTAMDYRLSDPGLDSPGGPDNVYAETTVRLRSFWCYRPYDESEVSPLPAITAGHVTFGCLNSFNKVNASSLALWAQVLARVPDARLLLMAPEGSVREWVRRVFAERGIAPTRITFVGREPRERYFQLYHRIDLCLDTLPYNGHTTSLDAYWMGVPVVTLVGRTVVGRAGWSHLSNLGLTEIAAHTEGEFVAVAANLATDRPRLAELRRTLRARMQASPLMDAPGFARGIEAAYRTMWTRWCGAGR